MVLPFGTFFANFLHFEHKGLDFFVRAQNASSTPSQSGPRDAVTAVAARLAFSE
jgi:hypothetical protein